MKHTEEVTAVKEARENSAVAARLSSVPKKPGVYLLKGPRERVLYVGKAKDLRARLGSYFRDSSGLDARKLSMVRSVRDFSVIVTDSELEALALEANLIKQHRPRFNVILRDDKGYPYLRLDRSGQWPRFEVVRRIKRDRAMYFGPYVQAGSMWEALRFINRHFGLRPCGYRLDRPMRPCVQHEMGRCPAPCAGLVSKKKYLKAVDEAVAFLKGRRAGLLGQLEKRMEALSGQMRYEEAAELRDRIRLLRKAWESQKVVAPELGDLDVLGFYRQGRDAAAQVFFIRNGVMVGARDYHLRAVGGMTDGELLHDFVLSLYSGPVAPVREVVVSALPDDAVAISSWLHEMRGGKVRITVPARGKRRDLLRMAEKNARLRLEARSAEGLGGTLDELRSRLGLEEAPRSVGAFDVSNFSGSEPVGAFVFWEEGEFRKDLYRHMRIKGVEGIDDYAMMRETVRRALEDLDEKKRLPDIVMIDGGRGHLEAAREAAKGLAEAEAVIAVAKKPDRAFGAFGPEPLDLEDRSPSSLLLKLIRDEAHRFAISYHKKLRGKRLMDSPLEAAPGIGKKRRLALLKHFKGIEAIRKAGVEELAAVPGMNRRAAEALLQYLRTGHRPERQG